MSYWAIVQTEPQREHRTKGSATARTLELISPSEMKH